MRRLPFSPILPCLAAALSLAACPEAPSTTAAHPSSSAPAPPRRGTAAAEGPPAGSSAAQPSPPPPLPERIEGMILVPAGPFTMGADEGGEPDERPAHQVTLAAYYLDITEVTNEAYQQAVAAGVCRAPSPRSAKVNKLGPDKRFRGPRQPVSSISWDDAKAYCEWAGKRLPTEAELEKAARGTDGRRFPWGDEPPDEIRARYRSGVTADVGSYPEGAGPYGHLDLTGNVWEWADDVYDPYAYRRPWAAAGRGATCEDSLAAFAELRRQHKQGFTGSNPIPQECERVLRGGAFNYHAAGLRSTNRVHHPGRYRLVMSGFRCAKDAVSASPKKP